jgi:hypothetical protein
MKEKALRTTHDALTSRHIEIALANAEEEYKRPLPILQLYFNLMNSAGRGV